MHRQPRIQPAPFAHAPGDGLDLTAISERQVECLYWAEQGKSATDIGAILGISRRTVEGHLAKAFEILGVRTRIQAVILARELGLIDPTVRLRSAGR